MHHERTNINLFFDYNILICSPKEIKLTNQKYLFSQFQTFSGDLKWIKQPSVYYLPTCKGKDTFRVTESTVCICMVDQGVINTYYVEKGRTSYLMEAFPPESCASYRLNQKYIQVLTFKKYEREEQ